MGWRSTLIVFAVLTPRLAGELLPIRSYTTADGLASDRIYSITPDSRGFVWICTPEGLSRFDGTHFVSYGPDEGLPHRAAYSVTETRSGDHWIATPRGLTRVNPSGPAAWFVTYKPSTENFIGAVIETRSGAMLAATESGLIEWTDPLHFRRREIPALKARISDIAEDAAGNLWIGTTAGIAVVRGNEIIRSFTLNDGLPGDWVEMFLPDSKGRMWVALRGGLAQFSLQANAGWRLENTYTVASGLVDNVVSALKEASDGTLWVGTSQGISRLRRQGDARPTIENLTRAQGLSDRAITALAEDQAGNIWAGTESAGVMRIGRVGFTTYREQDGLRSDRVWALATGGAGELIAVTIPAGQKTRSVDLFDGVRFRNLAPGTFADHPTWGWNQVLLQSRAGEWWAATSQGICRYPAVKAAELNGARPRACYGGAITTFRIFEDSKGGVWASAQSGHGDRLMRWNPASDTVEEFQQMPMQLASAFAEDRQGNVWIGMFTGGLYRYDGREFQRFAPVDGIPGGAILALLSGSSGLWIGSNGGGLGRIEDTSMAHPKVQIYDSARGMASNIVQCLVEDRAGRIYAGTGKGVDRLDPLSGHIRHFSRADGLARGELHGAVRDRSGALWFATTQGVSRLVPVADPPEVKPRILITDLRIGGKPYRVSQLGETRIGPIEMQPSQNQLQADFAGIDYEPGHTVRYSYRLEGADEKWSAPRYQGNVNFAALEAGSYRFLVKAVASEGAESAPAEIDFVVLPPVWKRWWFLALAVALAAGLVLAAHRYRMSQMLSLERMRTAIATDLHDDIGASLSQIAILSEVARVRGNGQGSDAPLERVAMLARELVDSMGDIVWSIRSEPRGMDSLVRRMREFALDVLASQGIDFELRAPAAGDSMKLSLQTRRQLFLMFKECIHNAARHSVCTAVTAELAAGDRDVVLTVEDNGVGLPANGKAPASHGGTGIQGMHNRAKELGGQVRLTSSPGHGCRVEIRLPVRRGVLSRAIS
jgi:ligand-binding sensor domain-containing protein/signal transduction histidine kinase